MSFAPRCTGCGACCRQVGRALTVAREWPRVFPAVVLEALRQFPHGVTADGACQKLDDGGRCTVYEARPLICRVDDLAAAQGLDDAENVERQARACDRLQQAEGLGPNWRVSRE